VTQRGCRRCGYSFRLTQPALRAAIQATNIQTLQGPISFDKNGDLQHPLISIFQATHNTKYPDTDLRQFKYVRTTVP
jgi:hypothetical protein